MERVNSLCCLGLGVTREAAREVSGNFAGAFVQSASVKRIRPLRGEALSRENENVRLACDSEQPVVGIEKPLNRRKMSDRSGGAKRGAKVLFFGLFIYQHGLRAIYVGRLVLTFRSSFRLKVSERVLAQTEDRQERGGPGKKPLPMMPSLRLCSLLKRNP